MRIATLSVSQSATGSITSNPYPVNWRAQNFGLGLGLTMTAAKGIGADLEVSFDDPKVGFTTWFKHAAVTGKTTAASGEQTVPITAIRINVTAASVTGGTTALQIVQSE